jgi:Leucine-rich repeat (LRR) protein
LIETVLENYSFLDCKSNQSLTSFPSLIPCDLTELPLSKEKIQSSQAQMGLHWANKKRT